LLKTAVLFVTVGTGEEVATIKISEFDISVESSVMFLTISLNLPAIFWAFSLVLLTNVICLFEVCLTRFSQVFRPIFPTPKRSIFLLCKSSILSKIYLTAAYETDVAPEESFVSFLILLLACITELKSLSR